jgi:hypothetical protein
MFDGEGALVHQRLYVPVRFEAKLSQTFLQYLLVGEKPLGQSSMFARAPVPGLYSS